MHTTANNNIDAKVQELQHRAQTLHHTTTRALDTIHSTAQQQLHTLRTQHMQHMQQGMIPGPPLPSDPGVLVAELQNVQVGTIQTQRLQALQASVRALDKAIHGLERAAAMPSSPAIIEQVGAAVTAYTAAVPDVQAFQAVLTDAGIVLPDIVAAGHAMADRVDAAQHTLRNVITQQLQQQLGQLGWPPAGLATAGLPDGPQGGLVFTGFDGDGGGAVSPLLSQVQQLLGTMTMLQRAVQAADFAAALDGRVMEGPALWGMRALTQPVGDVLVAVYESGHDGAAAAPERVFIRAIQLARLLAPLMSPLQRVFDALGLTVTYDASFEVARSVREEVKDILRTRLLPTLLTRQQPTLWTHVMNEMLHFERALAPLHGVSVDAQGALLGRHDDTLVSVLFEQQAWADAWLGAELQALSTQLDAVCDGDEGWAPLANLWAQSGGGGEEWTNGGAEATIASAHEFYPPYCADVAVGLVTAAVRRSAWCGTRSQRRKYLKHVPGQLLKSFRARLQRTGKVAEEYRDLTGPRWGPRLATCINAAHYMEHQLREPEVMALLATDADDDIPTPVTSPSQGPSGAPAPPSGSLASILERESAGYGWMKREWTLKMARAVADGFVENTKQYRWQLERFRNPAAPADPPPSPTLVAALEQLQGTLRMLSQHLDAVAFRELWRAVAVAANQLLFNDVVTEASFTYVGAQQLSADVDALASLLGAFTRRPLAHVRELDEARRLLLLAPKDATALQGALAAGGQQAREALTQYGCSRLTDIQAAAVLGAMVV